MLYDIWLAFKNDTTATISQPTLASHDIESAFRETPSPSLIRDDNISRNQEYIDDLTDIENEDSSSSTSLAAKEPSSFVYPAIDIQDSENINNSHKTSAAEEEPSEEPGLSSGKSVTDAQDSLHSDQVKNTLIKTTSSKDLKICNQKDITAEKPGPSSSYSVTDVLDSQNKDNPCNNCLTAKPLQ